MAFVYRSPRHLDKSLEPNHMPNQIEQNSKQNRIPQLKKPIKGFVHRRSKEHSNTMADFMLGEIENEKIKNEMDKEVTSMNGSNCSEQYFFKGKETKVLRNIVNVSEEDDSKSKLRIQNCEDSKTKNEKPQIKLPVNSSKIQPILSSSLPKSSPNSYLPFLINVEKENKFLNMNLLHSKKTMREINFVPSIPGKIEKFGYVVKDNKLTYPQKVAKPNFEGEDKDFPGPTDYNVTIKTKVQGFKIQSLKENLTKSETSNFYALVDDQDALKIHNEKIKKWVEEGKENKKKTKPNYIMKPWKRENLETRDLSTDSKDSNESGETVYDDKTTPGPGYYNSSPCNQKKNFRSKNESFQKIFYSQSQRFDLAKSKAENINCLSMHSSESIPEFNKEKKNKFFISKLKRDIKLETQTIAPPPGYYDVRVSMENDIISKIIRNSPNLFQNNLDRLQGETSFTTPGPGSYSTHEPKFKVESFLPSGKVEPQLQKKSTLSSSESILIQNPNKANTKIKKIHEREDSVVETENYAPFMSTSPKGLSIKEENFTPISYSPLKVSERTKQNFCPFNSSESKEKEQVNKYIAEVGLYDSGHLKEWEKKSFNILFN